MLGDIGKVTRVFCDIDGCLNAGKNIALDLKNLLTLQDTVGELQDRDVEVSLCTGRPQPYAEAVAQIVGTRGEIICENGAIVYDPRDDSWRPTGSFDSNAFQKFRMQSNQYAKENSFSIEPGKEFCISFTSPNINQFSKDEFFTAIASIKEYFESRGWYELIITHSSTAIDVSPFAVNKARGIRFLKNQSRVPWKYDLAIGDSNGDLAVFGETKFCACPANASNEVKEMVNFVSAKPYVEGTNQIFELLLSELT